MSHIVTMETQFKDAAALAAACNRLGLPEPEEGTFKLFQSNVTGTAVRLKGWSYPVVVLADGSIKFDNYGGSWGSPQQLDAFKQAYSVEVVKRAAARRGMHFAERALPSGEVQLVTAVH